MESSNLARSSDHVCLHKLTASTQSSSCTSLNSAFLLRFFRLIESNVWIINLILLFWTFFRRGTCFRCRSLCLWLFLYIAPRLLRFFWRRKLRLAHLINLSNIWWNRIFIACVHFRPDLNIVFYYSWIAAAFLIIQLFKRSICWIWILKGPISCIRSRFLQFLIVSVLHCVD